MRDEESDGDELFDDETPGVFRDAQLAVAPDRTAIRPLRAAWNGDSETVERITVSASDGPVTQSKSGEVGRERAAEPEEFDFDGFDMAHRRSLLAKLIPFCGGDRHLAEDIVQQTFLVAYTYRAQLPELDDPAAWLYVVATRAAKTFFRREALRRERTRDRYASTDSTIEPDESVLLADLLDRLLDSKERRVVEYRYLFGHRRQWIAERMGVSLRTVDTRIKMALNKLKPYLAQSKEDES